MRNLQTLKSEIKTQLTRLEQDASLLRLALRSLEGSTDPTVGRNSRNSRNRKTTLSVIMDIIATQPAKATTRYLLQKVSAEARVKTGTVTMALWHAKKDGLLSKVGTTWRRTK
jgi:hypothetical protein